MQHNELIKFEYEIDQKKIKITLNSAGGFLLRYEESLSSKSIQRKWVLTEKHAKNLLKAAAIGFPFFVASLYSPKMLETLQYSHDPEGMMDAYIAQYLQKNCESIKEQAVSNKTQKQIKQDSQQELPLEIWYKILLSLSITDICTASLVCQAWKVLLRSLSYQTDRLREIFRGRQLTFPQELFRDDDHVYAYFQCYHRNKLGFRFNQFDREANFAAQQGSIQCLGRGFNYSTSFNIKEKKCVTDLGRSLHVLERENGFGETRLMILSQCGHQHILNQLFEHVLIEYCFNKSIIFLIKEKGYEKSIKALNFNLLFAAIKYKQVDKIADIKELLKINKLRDMQQKELLKAAILSGDLKFITYLVEEKIIQPDYTALHYAARLWNIKLYQYLSSELGLERCFNTQAKMPEEYAVEYNNAQLMGYLIEQEGDQLDISKLLEFACEHEHRLLVLKLLVAQAKFSFKLDNFSGLIKLIQAAFKNDNVAGLDVIIKKTKEECSAEEFNCLLNQDFFADVFSDPPKCQRYLIQHGADVEHKNDLGYTRLYVAVNCANEETIKVLLEEGADPDQPLPRTTPLINKALIRQRLLNRIKKETYLHEKYSFQEKILFSFKLAAEQQKTQKVSSFYQELKKLIEQGNVINQKKLDTISQKIFSCQLNICAEAVTQFGVACGVALEFLVQEQQEEIKRKELLRMQIKNSSMDLYDLAVQAVILGDVTNLRKILEEMKQAAIKSAEKKQEKEKESEEVVFVVKLVPATQDLLFIAAEHNQYKIIKMLIEQFNFEVNSVNLQQETALHIAVTRGQIHAAVVLLRYHARLNMRNAEGKTVWECAKSQNMKNLLKRAELRTKLLDSIGSGYAHFSSREKIFALLEASVKQESFVSSLFESKSKKLIAALKQKIDTNSEGLSYADFADCVLKVTGKDFKQHHQSTDPLSVVILMSKRLYKDAKKQVKAINDQNQATAECKK